VEQAQIIDNYILILDYIRVEFTSYPFPSTVEVRILARELKPGETELAYKVQYIAEC
jgi:hypothetical protein